MSAVAITDLRFSYDDGGFSLVVPSLEVASGARAGIVGPSGCGKSTLLRLVSGELLPTSGQVRVGDVAVSERSEAARRAWRVQCVGFVFQDFPLVDYLDALDNVLLPYRLHPALTLDDDARARAVGLLEGVGLVDKQRRRPRALSQGERQRVAIARALVAEPELLLADEPTTGLDGVSADAVMGLLETAVTARGMTLVMVTHDERVVGRFDTTLDLGAP